MEKVIEVFARLFDQLTWKSRIASFIAIAIIVFWIDSQMGFTYHYFMDRKLEEISKVNQVLKDTSFDEQTKELLKRERISIISKSRGILEPLERKNNDNSLAFHLSYTWVIILLIIALPISIYGNRYLSTEEKNKQFGGSLLLIIIITVVLYFIAKVLSTYLQSFLLYAINSVMQFTFVSLLLLWAHNSAKKA